MNVAISVRHDNTAIYIMVISDIIYKLHSEKYSEVGHA